MSQSIEQRGPLGEKRLDIEHGSHAEDDHFMELPLDSAGGILYRWLVIQFPDLSREEVRDILFPTDADARERGEENYLLTRYRTKHLVEWIANAEPWQVKGLKGRTRESLKALDQQLVEAMYARLGQVLMGKTLAKDSPNPKGE